MSASSDSDEAPAKPEVKPEDESSDSESIPAHKKPQRRASKKAIHVSSSDESSEQDKVEQNKKSETIAEKPKETLKPEESDSDEVIRKPKRAAASKKGKREDRSAKTGKTVEDESSSSSVQIRPSRKPV